MPISSILDIGERDCQSGGLSQYIFDNWKDDIHPNAVDEAGEVQDSHNGFSTSLTSEQIRNIRSLCWSVAQAVGQAVNDALQPTTENQGQILTAAPSLPHLVRWSDPPSGGGGGALPINPLFKGTTEPMNMWYLAGAPGAVGASSISGNLATAPFFSVRGGVVDQLAMETTAGAAGAKARCGIYSALPSGYPGQLLVQTAELDLSTSGLKAGDVSITLSPNTLYWFALFATSGSPVFSIIQQGLSLIGVSRKAAPGFPLGSFQNAPIYGLSCYSEYGSFPSTYPTDAFRTTFVPAVGAHFAS